MFPVGNLVDSHNPGQYPLVGVVSECTTSGTIHADRHGTNLHTSGSVR